MAEYSRIASGVAIVLSNGGTSPIGLPFLPDRISFVNYDAQASASADEVTKAWWNKPMGQGAAMYDFYDTGPVYSTGVTTTGGFSTFEGGQLLQFGAKKQIVSSTKGLPTTFTVTGHGYSTGDVVLFQGLYQSSTTGMPQMCGIPFAITVLNDNSFNVPWNSGGTNYTNLSASPVGATVMKVLYPSLYLPGCNFIDSITLGVTTSISFTTPHSYVIGQQVAFRIPPVWGTTQLNSLPNVVIPGSPIYGYVVDINDASSIDVNIDSSSFTAFNPNQPVASVSGLSFPQAVAVGDVNTGGFPISVGSPLYPPPTYLNLNGPFSTINGPAIQGAFVNNTSQGFVIGPTIAPTAGEHIYWEAYLDDLTVGY